MQEKRLKNKFLLIVIALTLIFSVLSPFLSGVAFAEDLTFSLDTNGYTGGTWTNQDVTIDIAYYGDPTGVTYEYSFSDEINFVAFDGSQTFTTEGSYYVYFRLTTQSSTSNNQFVYIRIDKTMPTITGVTQSQFQITNQNLELIILANDTDTNPENGIGISGVYEYKIPSTNWQSSNIFVMMANTTFQVGDIKIRDRAGNEVFYDQPYVISNIFKNPPEFTLTANTTTNTKSQLIMLENVSDEAGIESVLVTKPNGEVVDITQTYQEGFLVTENGTYIFQINSISGLQKSLSVRFKNINQPVEFLIFLASTSVLVALSVMVFLNAFHLTHKRKLKQKKRK